MRWAYLCIAGLCAFLLQGCATLPNSAPTAGQIERRADSPKSSIDFDIVDIDAAIATAPPRTNPAGFIELQALAAVGAQEPADTIRVGDSLNVQVYEVGVSLFAGQNPQPTTAQTPVANVQRFDLDVREDGTIDLPYLGRIEARGLSAPMLAERIRSRLRPLSESPEVLVRIADSVESVAYVTGSVARPGRYRLSGARERLLDVLALAGGPRIEPEDAELRIVRGEKTASVELAALRPEDLANIPTAPGDRIEILRRQKSFTVFGATDRVSRVPFEGNEVSLAEAVARVGGPSDSRANPRGVFLFRLEKVGEGDALKPVIYRLNLMNAESYFLAQMFQVRDKDVILFANADANISAKFISVLNQLFSPILTARVLTK